MLRISSAVAIGLALACAFVLYSVSYDTRQLDLRVQSQERRIERLRSDIALLKAELAYLSRPERIEPLARAMGFAPAHGEQYVDLNARVAEARAADGHARQLSAEIAPQVETSQQHPSRAHP